MSKRNMLVAVDIASIELLILEQEWMFSRRCVVLVAVGGKYEGHQKSLSGNEVAELSEAELIRLVYLQLGTPGSKGVDPKGPWTRRLYPHDGESLLIKERTEIRPSSSKDFEEEVVWR